MYSDADFIQGLFLNVAREKSSQYVSFLCRCLGILCHKIVDVHGELLVK